MTETCTCPTVEDGFRLAAEGHPPKPCRLHNPPPNPREHLALNDDAGLIAVLTAAVTGTPTTVKEL